MKYPHCNYEYNEFNFEKDKNIQTRFGFYRYIPDPQKYEVSTKYPQRQWQHIQKSFESLYPPPIARPLKLKCTKRTIKELKKLDGLDIGELLCQQLKEGK